MVGIVLVSHSARLAEGAAEVARAMGGANLRLKAVGGLDLPGQPLGTDPAAVLAAIEEVYSSDGVVILIDLGSAVLSAEMALDLLDPEKRPHVVISPAPFVEGAVAAAVQAGLGCRLEEVLAEASLALTTKVEHLGSPPPPPFSPPEPTLPAEPALELRLTLRNPQGLHARPAARFVQTAAQFPQAKVTVFNQSTGHGPANARSILSISGLGAAQGHILLLRASGDGAREALAALMALVEGEFD